MKITLNEASRFFDELIKMEGLEIANSTSNIPTSEIELWNNYLKKAQESDEVKQMINLMSRWKNLDKK